MHNPFLRGQVFFDEVKSFFMVSLASCLTNLWPAEDEIRIIRPEKNDDFGGNYELGDPDDLLDIFPYRVFCLRRYFHL